MVWPDGKKLKNGQYTIEETLRSGRLSTTYRAISRSKEWVVIKVTNDRAIDPKEFQALKDRFRDEAFRLAQCASPYIVKVEPSFEEENLVCIPMEYIAGKTLAEQYPRKLSEALALRYIRQVGEALVVLHGKNLVHRDVTLENIVLRPTSDGLNEAVLIDFGLVRDLQSGTRMTLMASDITPFTAPELCDSGEKRGEFTDLYALGAVLYTLVTGEAPLKAGKRKPGEKLNFPGGVHPKIAEAIENAMEFESCDRSKSVAEWLEMLPDIPLPGLTAATPPSPLTPEEKPKRTLEIAGLVVATLAMIFGAFQGVMAIVAYFYPKDAPAPIQSSPIVQPASPKPK